MAVTGAIFRSLEFGEVNSADYGIYITGEAAYNAPSRAVEMVSVPGRNGAIAIDQGYWENIEVTYPAGTFGEDQYDFATQISAFRNAILSQKGYQRLMDSYHPEEYRMATYISGLEVSPVNNSVAGEFELVFTCKPQRWLVSGEDAVTVASGDILANPTLYDASPLVEVEGYGTLTVNGYEIEIEDALMGDVTLVSSGTATTSSINFGLNTTLYNTGDTVAVGASASRITAQRNTSSVTFSSVSSVSGGSITCSSTVIKMTVDLPEWTFTIGTDASTTSTCTGTLTFSRNGTTSTGTITLAVRRQYTASAARLKYEFTTQSVTSYAGVSGRALGYGNVVVDSTLHILGHPTYVDCDLGVCYKIEDDTVVDLNPYIDLGSDIPVLSPGANAITYDDTITNVDIIPRWWQL